MLSINSVLTKHTSPTSFRINRSINRKKDRSCVDILTNILSFSKPHKMAPLRRLKHQQSKRSALFVFQDESHKWFKNRGMEKLQTFSEEELRQLKYIFKTLDYEKTNLLRPEQIYEPFLSLGLIESHEELDAMIKKLDENHNNLIEFTEFMKIAKMSLEDKTTCKIKNFFDNLLHNESDKPFQHSFMLFFSKKRRDTLMQILRSVIHNNEKGGVQTLNRMNAYKQMIQG